MQKKLGLLPPQKKLYYYCFSQIFKIQKKINYKISFFYIFNHPTKKSPNPPTKKIFNIKKNKNFPQFKLITKVIKPCKSSSACLPKFQFKRIFYPAPKQKHFVLINIGVGCVKQYTTNIETVYLTLINSLDWNVFVYFHLILSASPNMIYLCYLFKNYETYYRGEGFLLSYY